MPTEQYHEPPGELPEDVRTFARMCTSLIEEAEAIGWYAQRLAVEQDSEAAAIMRDAQDEDERSPHVAHVERLVVQVQHEDVRVDHAHVPILGA